MNPSQANKEDGPVEAMDWGPEELRLLRAGREEPTEASRAGIFAALGLDGMGPGGGPGDGGVQLPRAEAPPASLPSSPLPVLSAPTATASMGFGVGSWILVGALVAAVPVGLWLSGRSNEPEAPRDSAAAPADEARPADESASAVQDSASANQQREVRELGELPVDDAAGARDSASARAGSTTADKETTGSEGAASSLAEELTWIRRARTELAKGSPAAALTVLDEHAARYPRSQLQSEALVVRVEALVKQGRKDEARRVAAPLLAAGSVYAERVRSILGDPAP